MAKKKEAPKEAPKKEEKADPSVVGTGYVHLPGDGEATNGSPYSPIVEVVNKD